MGYRHRHAKSQSMRLLVKPCCCWLGGHLAVLCLLACLPAVGARSLSAHEPQSQNHLPVSRASSRGAGIAVPGSSTLVQSNDHLTGSRHEGAVEPYAAHHSAEPRCKLFQKKRRQLHHTIRKGEGLDFTTAEFTQDEFFGNEVSTQDMAKFEIVGLAGQGYHDAGVAIARHMVTGEQVAIKKIINVVKDIPKSSRTLKEIAIHARLTELGANVVQLKQILAPRDPRNFDSVFTVMELMDGDLAREYKTLVLLDLKVKKLIAYQLLSAVRDIHEAGFVHGDLKSDNVVLNHDCTTRLLDFGRSEPIRVKDGHPDSKRLTVPMPNRVEWHNGYLPSVDIWHVGRTLVDLSLGRHAFYDAEFRSDPARAIRAWLSEYGSPPPELFEWFDGNAQAAMEQNNTSGEGNRQTIEDLFPGVPPEMMQLCKRMLNWDLLSTPTAAELLRDPFFDDVRSDPLIAGDKGSKLTLHQDDEHYGLAPLSQSETEQQWRHRFRETLLSKYALPLRRDATRSDARRTGKRAQHTYRARRHSPAY